jgi:hypothetical protein
VLGVLQGVMDTKCAEQPCGETVEKRNIIVILESWFGIFDVVGE